MASAASTAVRVPANLSGAISTRMRCILPAPRGGAHRTSYDRVAMTTGSYDVLIRPMTAARRGRGRAAQRRRPTSSSTSAATRAAGRTRRSARRTGRRTGRRAPATCSRTDPGGCWVAERDGELVGLRDLAGPRADVDPGVVRRPPGAAGRGHRPAAARGRAAHGRGCLRGMLNASADPRALRRYRLAGFDLHPQMMLWGHVDRADLPVVRPGPRGRPGRLRPDGLDRPPGPGRRPRTRPRGGGRRASGWS